MADTQISPASKAGSAAASTSSAEDQTGGPAATRAADAAAVQRLTAYRRALEATATYAVGALVVEARESLGAALALPWRLLRLHRHHRHLERLASGTGSKTATKAGVGSAAAEFKALSVVAGDDTAKTIKALRAQGGELRSQGRALAVAAERLVETAPQQAVALAREAWARDPAPEFGRRLAFVLYRCGAIAEPAMLFARSDITRDASSAVRREAERVSDEDRLLREGISLPTRRARLFSTARGGPPRALYVAHLTLPHHRSGYAVRTHETLRALGREGIEAICVSRPGYPWDRRDAHNVGAARLEQQVDSVRYRHIADVSLPYTPLSRFVETAAKALGTEIDAFQPDAVIAGSNHVNALR